MANQSIKTNNRRLNSFRGSEFICYKSELIFCPKIVLPNVSIGRLMVHAITSLARVYGHLIERVLWSIGHTQSLSGVTVIIYFRKEAEACCHGIDISKHIAGWLCGHVEVKIIQVVVAAQVHGLLDNQVIIRLGGRCLSWVNAKEAAGQPGWTQP